MPSRFYAGPTTGDENVGVGRFGPFYPQLRQGTVDPLISVGIASRRSQQGRDLWQGGMAWLRFPGVLRIERPAKIVIACPDPGLIVDDSTFELNDGFDQYEFSFQTGGAPPPAPVIDISAAVSPADVAVAMAAAINAHTATLVQPAALAAGVGFIAYPGGSLPGPPSDPSQLVIIQCSQLPGLGVSPPGYSLLKHTWAFRCTGSFGNQDIAGTAAPVFAAVNPQNPTLSFAGGKPRKPGVLGLPMGAPGPRAMTAPFWFPEILPPE